MSVNRILDTLKRKKKGEKEFDSDSRNMMTSIQTSQNESAIKEAQSLFVQSPTNRTHDQSSSNGTLIQSLNPKSKQATSEARSSGKLHEEQEKQQLQNQAIKQALINQQAQQNDSLGGSSTIFSIKNINKTPVKEKQKDVEVVVKSGSTPTFKKGDKKFLEIKSEDSKKESLASKASEDEQKKAFLSESRLKLSSKKILGEDYKHIEEEPSFVEDKVTEEDRLEKRLSQKFDAPAGFKNIFNMGAQKPCKYRKKLFILIKFGYGSLFL